MGPGAGGAPTGDLAAAINAARGSFDTFTEKLANAGTTPFGTGRPRLRCAGGRPARTGR